MKLFGAVLIGIVILTFSWGWVMEVHYGHLSTDAYTHEYLMEAKEICNHVWFQARAKFDFFFNPNQPLMRRQFLLPDL